MTDDALDPGVRGCALTASSLVVDAAPNDPASVDVQVDFTNVLTVVFSLEALCP